MSYDAKRIQELGHRAFVGGNDQYWEEIANLQFRFLKSEGLKKEHTLLDIACGSLRAGRLFINYLDKENYLGIDKEINLIIHGVAQELGIEAFIEKQPSFAISSNFEFHKLFGTPDFAIAQSLLTHLTPHDIYICFKSLRDKISNQGIFYATFFEVDVEIQNLEQSDAIESFFYTKNQIQTIATLTGWDMQYIGDWGHPRNQKMIKLKPK